jgi:spore coat polysaccharide biosynthesis predicted glycosyltransferase SpsG
MFAICVESSHHRGMGHLFRALNFVRQLDPQDVKFVILLNEHAPSISILEQKGLRFKIVPLDDTAHNWERKAIEEFDIRVWINDRLDTTLEHANKIRQQGIPLVTFDDRGSGAELSNLHFAGLTFEKTNQLKGKMVFAGIDYLILNPDINKFKRQRIRSENILVTLGGTDTYGMTVRIVEMLARLGRPATAVVGPGFQHRAQLEAALTPGFQIAEHVPSLIEKFFNYDMAITGGGITPFEANASGLPCITVSSEPFEVAPCVYLQNLGTSLYLGHRDAIDEAGLKDTLSHIDVNTLSKRGMARIGTAAAQRILNEIRKL